MQMSARLAIAILLHSVLSYALPTREFLGRTLHPQFLQVQPPIHGQGVHGQNHTQPVQLTLQQKLLMCDITLGDGHSFKALVDTGSGNLAVPSANCRGCHGRRGFEPEDDASGTFVPSASDLHLSFASGKLEGSGFRGKVCLGSMCGQASFLVAASESAEFQHFGFDAILGLGPPRQALRPGFNVVGSLAEQGVLPAPSFLLSLRSKGNSSLTMGTLGSYDTSGMHDTVRGALPPMLAADARHGEWAVHLQDIKVDGKAIQPCGKEGCRAVLDSGCGGIALPAQVLKSLKSRLSLDGCSESAIQELPTLGFVLGNGHTYNLPPERYVEISTKPASEELTEDSGDDAVDRPHCHLMISPMGEYSTRTAILGLPFLLDRDVAFDQRRMHVGLADAP